MYGQTRPHADTTVHTMLPGQDEAYSLQSYDSADWRDVHAPIPLETKASTAASLTHAFMYGTKAWPREGSGTSISQQAVGGRDDNVRDMYGDTAGDVTDHKKKRVTSQKLNIRATLGFWKLLWFDFKNWYRRWKVKNEEPIFLKSYIKTMESHFGSAIGSLFIFTRWMMFLNLLLSILWVVFVILPTATKFSYSDNSGEFAFKNLFDGKGVIAQSWLFFGSYTSVLAGGYHMALAYLLLLLFTYFGSLFIILGNLARSDQGKTTSKLESRYKFSLMLWTSWDHTITSDEAAVNLSKGIASAFKDNLYEAKASQHVKERTRREKIKVYMLRTLAWFLTLILIGGGCLAIVYLVVYVNFETVIPNQGTGKGGTNFLSVYGTTIVFSLINTLVPGVVRQLPKMEMYASGRDEMNITLTRVFFLRMANLFSLITSLYNTITSDTVGCTGTVIGQELYKLVIMDTMLHSAVKLTMQFTTYYWKGEKAEFNISSEVLVLIYRQALIWVGTIACPLMPLLGLLSNLIFFYVNYTIVSRTCKPPIKRWNQSRNTAFFSSFLLGSLALLIPPISIVIGSSYPVNMGLTEVPGEFCGPFGPDKPTRAYTRFWKEQPPWLKNSLRYVTTEPVLIPMFMVLMCLLIHNRRRINNEKRQTSILHEELVLEREENEKLMKKLQSLGVGMEHHFH